MGFLNNLHALFAYAGFVATLFWAGAILIGAGDIKRFDGIYRKSAMIAQSTVGLSAVLGLISTFLGPFMSMIFPWAGLVVVALHGVLGKRAKVALYNMNTGKALKLAAVQLLLLIVAMGLMAVKPF